MFGLSIMHKSLAWLLQLCLWQPTESLYTKDERLTGPCGVFAEHRLANLLSFPSINFSTATEQTTPCRSLFIVIFSLLFYFFFSLALIWHHGKDGATVIIFYTRKREAKMSSIRPAQSLNTCPTAARSIKWVFQTTTLLKDIFISFDQLGLHRE